MINNLITKSISCSFPALLITFLTVCCVSNAAAQHQASINGMIKNEKGEPLAGATVFLANTHNIMATNNAGLFHFNNISAGTYQLVVKMMGYSVYADAIQVRAGMPVVQVSLKQSSIGLGEVQIAFKDPRRKDLINLFKDNFLGLSKYGRNCKILNPEIIKIKLDKSSYMVEAHTNDFLVVENPLLGYRIKYLLKAFTFRLGRQITNYDGNMVYEELDGTKEQQDEWRKNRLKIYQGSMMRFFRALYQSKDEPLKEGFVTRNVLKDAKDMSTDAYNLRMRPPILASGELVKFDTIVSIPDPAHIVLKFRQALIVTYDRNKLLSDANSYTENVLIPFGKETSILNMVLNDVTIDVNGNYTDYRAFLIRGHWADMRIGDQLPLDYEPPQAAIN